MSSSPMVAPSASTASFLSVYGLSGVGIRILVAIVKVTLFEARAIVFEKPYRHVARLRGFHRRAFSTLAGLSVSGDGDNDVRKRRPRVVKIVLRRMRRMIR